MLVLTGVMQKKDQRDDPCQNDMSGSDQEARAEDILEHGLYGRAASIRAWWMLRSRTY